MGNYILKRDDRDFLRIVIEVRRRSLCGLCLSLWRGARGRLDKTVWEQDMTNNLLGMRVNLGVFGVIEVLLKLGYATSQLKNLEGRGRQQKKGAKIRN